LGDESLRQRLMTNRKIAVVPLGSFIDFETFGTNPDLQECEVINTEETQKERIKYERQKERQSAEVSQDQAQ
jgi:hypothetical protein